MGTAYVIRLIERSSQLWIQRSTFNVQQPYCVQPYSVNQRFGLPRAQHSRVGASLTGCLTIGYPIKSRRLSQRCMLYRLRVRIQVNTRIFQMYGARIDSLSTHSIRTQKAALLPAGMDVSKWCMSIIMRLYPKIKHTTILTSRSRFLSKSVARAPSVLQPGTASSALLH